jgi:hypothetical protein
VLKRGELICTEDMQKEAIFSQQKSSGAQETHLHQLHLKMYSENVMQHEHRHWNYTGDFITVSCVVLTSN